MTCAAGDITDRSGDVLATTAYRDLLAAYPDTDGHDQRDAVATGLAGILGMNATQEAALRSSFGYASTDDSPDRRPSQYVVVSKQLTETQSDQVRAGLADDATRRAGPGAARRALLPTPAGRPARRLASQLLGFVTQDGQGRYGVEQASQPSWPAPAARPRTRPDNAPLPQTGGIVQLDDRREPAAAPRKRALRGVGRGSGAARHGRRHGPVYRRDPGLGLRARLRREQLRGRPRRTPPDLFADPIASQVYEPGSVMKMFTAAAALEKGVVTSTTPDPGPEGSWSSATTSSRTSTRRAWASSRSRT